MHQQPERAVPITGKSHFADGRCLSVVCGSMAWYFMGHGGDVLWRQEECPTGAETEEVEFAVADQEAIELVDEVPWRRWCGPEPVTTLAWRPALPDRAVVVRPRYPLALGAGSSLEFFVGLPLFLQVGSEHWQGGTIMDAALVPLSKTWFGTHSAGELAWAARTRARRTIDELGTLPEHRCLCHLRIANECRDPVTLDRVLIRAPALTLYLADRLWTNDVSVVIDDPLRPVEVRLGDGPPEHHPRADLVMPPRTPGRSLFRSLAIF